jgi:hypothetical protein
MARHVKMIDGAGYHGLIRGFLGNQAIYIGDTPGGLLIVVNRFQTGFANRLSDRVQPCSA